MLLRSLLVCSLLFAAVVPCPGEDRPPRAVIGKPLPKAFSAQLEKRDPDIDVTYWIGGASGPAWHERDAKTIMPTASAIKAFYLVEMFTAHADRLDQPIPDARQILVDDHPAISHFAPEVRDEIRKELIPASVRRVGEIMQGKAKASNPVYNAAANLITAHLGGPEQLTARIHARDPRFKAVVVRRYMLRDRTMPGDNEATAESLAALHQALASRSLSGVSEPVMTAVHEVLCRDPEAAEPHFQKDGALGSNPLTSVKAGWKQTAAGPVVYVIMCRQPIAAKSPAKYEALRQFATDLRDEGLKSGTVLLKAAGG